MTPKNQPKVCRSFLEKRNENVDIYYLDISSIYISKSNSIDLFPRDTNDLLICMNRRRGINRKREIKV